MKTAPLKKANRTRNYSESLCRERLVKLRNEVSHLTQEDLSKELGVNRSIIAKLETGERKLSTDLLYQLAQYYDTSADYILGLTEVSHTETPLPACDKLGLSDRATQILEEISQNGPESRILSRIIEHDYFKPFLFYISMTLPLDLFSSSSDRTDTNVSANGEMTQMLRHAAKELGYALIPYSQRKDYNVYMANLLMKEMIFEISETLLYSEATPNSRKNKTRHRGGNHGSGEM